MIPDSFEELCDDGANYSRRVRDHLLPEEIINRDEARADFVRALRELWPLAALFAGVIGVATLGYVALGWPVSDALYMVVISVFSVGYGETRPVQSLLERAWTMGTIVAGWVALVTTLGVVFESVSKGSLH